MRTLSTTILTLSLILLSLGLPARSEEPSPSTSERIAPKLAAPWPRPIDRGESRELIEFHFFFRHLANLDAAADGAMAAGNPDAGDWKNLDQRGAGLTDAEGAILKEVAYGCNQSVRDYDAALSPSVPGTEELPAEGLPAGKMDIVRAALEELRAQLGEAAYQGLASYVHTTFGPDLEEVIEVPGPMPPVSSVLGGDGLVPPLETTAAAPEIYVISHISKLSGNQVMAECQTTLVDDLTAQSYPFGITGCQVNGTLGGAPLSTVHLPCAFVDTCSGLVSIGPGSVVWADGTHALQLRTGQCTIGSGSPGLHDPMRYCVPPLGQIPFYNLSGSVRPKESGPTCWPPNHEGNCYVALSRSRVVVFIEIGPLSPTLYPGGQLQFSHNLPAFWINTGPGTVSSTGFYRAPATISVPQTDIVQACDLAFFPHPDDCVQAAVQLMPFTVNVTPDDVEVLPGTALRLTVTVPPSAAGQAVEWSLTTTGSGPAGQFFSTSNTEATYMAPANTSLDFTQDVTVKACVKPDANTQPVCGTALLTVPKMDIVAQAEKTTLIPGESVRLTVFVNGSAHVREVSWKTEPAFVGVLTTISSDPLHATYTAPNQARPTGVDIVVCLRESEATCNAPSHPLHLNIVDPVVITSLTGSWNAGQTGAFTITGTGFGSSPQVRFDHFASVVSSVTNTQIQGTVFIPVSAGGKTTRAYVKVNLGSNGIVEVPSNPQGIAQANLRIDPPEAQVRIGDTKLFQGLCLTATGVLCTTPETPTWHANLGTIDGNGRYSPPSSLPASGSDIVQACWIGAPCPTAPVTLLPAATEVAVNVTPKTPTVLTGTSKLFMASVTGTPNTAVTWSLSPQVAAAGSINQSGLYTAPATLGSVTTVTVTATSQADITKKNSTTLTLAAPPLYLSCTPSPSSSPYGRTIHWTATATGGVPGTIQYAFFRRPSGTSPWIPPVSTPGWQPNGSFSWTPTSGDTGPWDTYIWARDANTQPNQNGNGYTVSCNPGGVQITTPAPLTLTSTMSPASSAPNAPITWTATSTGGIQETVQYAFFRRPSGTTVWTPPVGSPNWQSSRTHSWTPSGSETGFWDTYVWVRDINTTPTQSGYGYAVGFNTGGVLITSGVAQAYPAKGWVNGYNTQHIWGWACDPDYPEQSNRVDVWGTNGQNYGSVGAYLTSNSGIAAQCLGGTAHYFDFPLNGAIPSGTHFQVWSIDLPYATPGNANRRCGGTGAIGDGTEFVMP